MIVVAIVGNAAEHSTAIIMAMKNKMDLSVGIAIGSSLQIALFVAPVLVFLSYSFGRPMDLEFTLPEIFAVVASIYILFQISGDGETNWIEGVQLLSVYLILGILFFYLPETAPGPRLALNRTRRTLHARQATRRASLAFSLSKRMNDKAADRDADAGVGDIKRRPGMRERNVQIEEQKIDHVTVKQAIGQVSHDAGQEQARAKHRARRRGAWRRRSNSQHEDERDAGEDDEKQVVVLEGTESGSGVGDENQGEEFRDDDARLFRNDVTQDQPLRALVERVERQGEEEEEFHPEKAERPTLNVQRPTSNSER